MRSTYRVSKIYRVLGIVFLISNFFIFLGTVDLINDVSFLGAIFVVFIFFILSIIFLIKSRTEAHKRIVAYEKGKYYNGRISVKKYTERGDYKSLRIGVAICDGSVTKYLTDANCYKPEELKLDDKVRICIYKNMVLLDDFNDENQD